MKFLFLSLILCSSVSAMSELDQRLQGYIQTFNLAPMSPPGPVNKKLFALGRQFFFEKRISGNNNISCADCHHPMTMTHDGIPLGIGEGAAGIETKPGGRQQQQGRILARNTPALFNLHAAPVMFWDGRVSLNPQTGSWSTPSELPASFKYVLKNALAAQALFPMVNHDEMRGLPGTNEVADASSDQEAWTAIFKKIIAVPNYKSALEELFPGEELNLAHVAQAIAHFEEQAFSAADTNYDRYLKGDLKAMTEVQKLGMDAFFSKGKCGECHRGEHLSDFSFHNIGVPQIGPGKMNGDDFGRYEQDPRIENLYAFRVPGLRNASMTAPYMHNGSFKTLAQVIEHYDDIEGSLDGYVFVNNYKNYFEKLAGAKTETNAAKLNTLSSKLTPRLNFEETEEKAIAEFIRGALTERRFLDAEISSDYIASLRIQLTQEGHQKILENLPSDAMERKATYYYFDVLTSEGYGLRELEKPIKIYFTQTDEETRLIYRKQLYKSSGSMSGVIAGATFEDEEIITLSEKDGGQLAALNNDFFNRLYEYNDGVQSRDIPEMELAVMKNDVLGMNSIWQELNFKNRQVMSDELNRPADKLFFAPTSTNTKTEYFWTQELGNQTALAVLQESKIRTETGRIVTTWSVELKLPKLSKKVLPKALDQWLKELVSYGMIPSDAQGTSPSPSKLTEKVLGGMF